MTGRKAVCMARPLITGAVVSALAILALAFLMLKMEWGSETIRNGVLAVYGLACFFGGWSAGHNIGSRRFLAGLGYGVLYFVLLWALSLAGGRQLAGDGARIAVIFLICSVTGMAGGIFSGFFK